MNGGRLIDIPYATSPPILFTFQESAALVGGDYQFTGAKAPFTPSRPILPNALYSFETMDFSMNIAEGDYQGAYGAAGGIMPEFSMYLQSDASAPAFREPIPLAKYLATVPYRLHILGSQLLGDAYPGQNAVTPTQGFSYNRLLGNIAGTLIQTAALMGQTSVTGILVMSAQEIVDENFVMQFRALAGRQSILAQDLRQTYTPPDSRVNPGNRLMPGREFF